jgi:hypothetical protein
VTDPISGMREYYVHAYIVVHMYAIHVLCEHVKT